MNTQNNGRAVAQRPQQAPALVPDNVGPSLLSAMSPDRLEVLRKQIAPGASNAELEHFLALAAHNKLDPFTSPPQCWLIPRKVKVADANGNESYVRKYVPQMAVDGLVVQAKRTGRYQGHSLEYRTAEQGAPWLDDWFDEDNPPAACRVTIPVQGWPNPIRFIARWREFAQFDRGGNLYETWAKLGVHMLGRRALFHGLKEFPLPERQSEDFELVDDGADFDSDGMSRAAFWAWADEQGYSEQTVRRCLQVTDGQSLGAAVERYGGWNKARSYVEIKGPVAASLPALAAGDRAADLLSEPSAHRDPLGVERKPQNVTPNVADSEPASRDRVADNGTPEAAPVIRCWQCGEPATHIPNPNGVGALCAAHLPPGVDPETGEMAGDAPSEPELCQVCGQSPPEGATPNGLMACQECMDQAEREALAAQPMPGGMAIPKREDAPAMPADLEPSVASMIAALKLHCDLTEAEARLRMNRLGKITLNAQTSAETLARLWAQAAAA